MRSLRSRLWLLWILAVGASAVVSVLLYQLYDASITAQEQRAEAVVARACDAIRARYGFYVAGWNGTGSSPTAPDFRRDLGNVVVVALRDQSGVEGGVWSAAEGPLAYAYPTYQGTSRKTDLPAAERGNIEAINAQAERSDRAVLKSSGSGTQFLILAACPLAGPYARLTGWAMTRVQGSPGYDRLRIGVAVVGTLVLAMAAWMTWLTRVWGRHVRTIETTLAEHGRGTLPTLAPTGERELDRVIGALNDAGMRLAQSQKQAEELAVRAAAAERLAALGRVTAGVAHEIRNPLAAMRLKAENALASDEPRCRKALEASLGQIARLDRLVAELLTMTQRRELRGRMAPLDRWLADRVDQHRETADRAGVILEARAESIEASVDPEMLGRALDNLLLNALQHTPAGGQVTVRARAHDAMLEISVANSGRGIADDIRDTLFEPFVTGRPEGTGLGLAIARELAQAHGGDVRLASAGSPTQDTVFILEVPWRRS